MERPLLGRQREQEILEREFNKALSGQVAVTLIAGEPGIGKTHLLTRFAHTVEQNGTLVLHGIAFEMEGMPPYLPFLEALGRYIRATPLALLQKQLDVHAATLAGHFPEISLRLDNLHAVYELHPEQARFRLFEAVARFIANICRTQPVLLLLDDLQWADAASLDLLNYLVRHQPHCRLMVLGGARSGEGMHADFAYLLAELERLRRLTLIELAPLAADAVGQLADHYLGAALHAEARAILCERSEGNPFFGEELLRNWQEMGQLVRGASGWRLATQATDELPASILRAIEQRLARLPAQSVENLRSAAIIGRWFEIGLLAEATGQKVESVERHLSPALQANLIRRESRGYLYSHDLIREALYQQVSPSRRQRLHGFIGRAREARQQSHNAQQNAQQLSNLAFHFTRSGDSERGIRYVELAAQEALRAYAPKEAIRHYQTGLALLDQREQLGLSVPPLRGELLLGLGEASLQGGSEKETIHAFEAALALFRQSGDHALAVRAAHGLGRAHWQVEAIAAAEEAFGLALRLLDEDVGVEAAQIHVDLANLLVLSRHQHDLGMVHAQHGLEIARALEDDQLVASALRTLGNLYVRTNRLEEGIASLEQALAMAMAADSPHEAAETCTGLFMAVMWQGNIRRMEEVAMQLMDFAQRCQTRYYLRHVHALQGIVTASQGELDAARHAFAQGQEIVASLANPEPLAFLHLCQAYLAYYTGDHVSMLADISQAVATFHALGEGVLIWYLGMEGLAYALNGHHAEAHARRAELERLLHSLPAAAMPAAEAHAQLALIALATGEHHLLSDLHAGLLPFRGQHHDAFIDRLLGTIEVVLGEWDAAEATLQSAESFTRRFNLRWELAHTLVARADLELARGGSGSAQRARRHLAEALDIFSLFGNQGEIRRVRGRLRDLPTQPGEKPQDLTPAGLSRREMDVLRLLAQGMSNREIGKSLALSPKTIANHVTMIFNKIGVDNRAAAAAFAVRQGIE